MRLNFSPSSLWAQILLKLRPRQAEKKGMKLLGNKPGLGDCLVRGGLLTRAQMRSAQKRSQNSGLPLCQTLLTMGLVDETSMVDCLAQRLEMPAVGLESLGVDQTLLALLPAEQLAAGDLLPLKKVGATLTLAMADPTDRPRIEKLSRHTGLKVLPVLAPPSALAEIHHRLKSLEDLRRFGQEGDNLDHLLPFFQRVEDYRFESVIGRGGFGVVCRCWQISLDRPVAIKVLNPSWNPVAQIAQRFKREGQIIAQLEHPNIIRVHEQGESEGVCFIVMEYFEGLSLKKHLAGKDWCRKLSVLLQVCQAIQFAHHKGVIHRDIKPGNILVNSQGAIKLLDFGVAHFDAAPAGLTGPQVVLGTPKYMAPELSLGADQSSPASDIYAFGVMAYEILTGLEFEPGTLRHPSDVDGRIPREMGDMILRCAALAAGNRPASFTQVAQVFQRAMDHMLFGEAPTTGAGQTTARTGAAGALEKQFEFKAILRQDDHGRVIHAHHHKMDREVLIKILGAGQACERLGEYTELRDLHIGEIYGLGRHGNLVLIVSEWLGGGLLTDLMGTDVAPGKCVDVLEGVIQALKYSELANLPHGNLHPGNVLFSRQGVVKVVDFGLAPTSASPFTRYRMPRADKAQPFEADRYGLNVMAYELISRQEYRTALGRVRMFEQLMEDPKPQPLLKYFVGRLWAVREQYPAYESYDAMLVDLERVRHRLDQLPDWTSDSAGQTDEPSLAPTVAAPLRSTALLTRTLSLFKGRRGA